MRPRLPHLGLALALAVMLCRAQATGLPEAYGAIVVIPSRIPGAGGPPRSEFDLGPALERARQEKVSGVGLALHQGRQEEPPVYRVPGSRRR